MGWLIFDLIQFYCWLLFAEMKRMEFTESAYFHSIIFNSFGCKKKKFCLLNCFKTNSNYLKKVNLNYQLKYSCLYSKVRVYFYLTILLTVQLVCSLEYKLKIYYDLTLSDLINKSWVNYSLKFLKYYLSLILYFILYL